MVTYNQNKKSKTMYQSKQTYTNDGKVISRLRSKMGEMNWSWTKFFRNKFIEAPGSETHIQINTISSSRNQRVSITHQNDTILSTINVHNAYVLSWSYQNNLPSISIWNRLPNVWTSRMRTVIPHPAINLIHGLKKIAKI